MIRRRRNSVELLQTRRPIDFARSRVAAFVAASAYCQGSDELFAAVDGETSRPVAEAFAGVGWAQLRVVRTFGAAAAIIANPDRGVVWVGVRGTDSVGDFYHFNGRCRLATWSDVGGRVHSGFARYARLIRRAIDCAIRDLTTDGQRPALIVSGHSLGAAAGAILAAELGAVRFYGFGMPRVFDAAGCRAFRSRVNYSERWVDCADPVCRVPRFGYRHATPPHYRASDGRVYFNPGPVFQMVDRSVSRCRRIARAGRELANAFVAVADHSVDRYTAAVDVARSQLGEIE